MPYIVDDEDKNGDNLSQQQQTNNQLNLGPESSDLGADAESGSGSGGAGQGAPKATESGSYTNLQKYINVNKDQAAQLGDKLATPIVDQANQAKSQATNANTNFNNQVAQNSDYSSGLNVANKLVAPLSTQKTNLLPGLPDTGTIIDNAGNPFANQPAQQQQQQPPSGGLVTKFWLTQPKLDNLPSAMPGNMYPSLDPYLKQNPADLFSTSSELDPTAISSDQSSDLQKALSGVYSGPKDFTTNTDYQGARDLYNQAQQKANLADSEAGRFALLKDTFQTPTYTRGQQFLDNSLLQQSDEGQAALAGLKSKIADVPNTFSSLEQLAQDKVNAANQSAVDAKTQGTSALQKAIDNRLANIHSRSTYEQNLGAESLAALGKDIGQFNNFKPGSSAYNDLYQRITGKMPIEPTSPMGPFEKNGSFIDLSQIQVSPGDFVMPAQGPNASANDQNVASAKEQAQIAALNSLLGKPTNDLPAGADIGSYHPENYASFNRQGYEDALIDRMQQYQANSPWEAWRKSDPGRILDQGTFEGYAGGPGAYAQQLYQNALKEQTAEGQHWADKDNAYRIQLGLPQIDASNLSGDWQTRFDDQYKNTLNPDYIRSLFA